jgi:hypothetical protein
MIVGCEPTDAVARGTVGHPRLEDGWAYDQVSLAGPGWCDLPLSGDDWVAGFLRTPGTLEHWNPGTLEHLNTGTLELWNTGRSRCFVLFEEAL